MGEIFKKFAAISMPLALTVSLGLPAMAEAKAKPAATAPTHKPKTTPKAAPKAAKVTPRVAAKSHHETPDKPAKPHKAADKPAKPAPHHKAAADKPTVTARLKHPTPERHPAPERHASPARHSTPARDEKPEAKPHPKNSPVLKIKGRTTITIPDKASSAQVATIFKKAGAKPVAAAKVAAEKKPLHTQTGLMINLDTGQPIGGKSGELNADLRFNEASMTKLITLYIALKEIEAGRLKPGDILDVKHPKLVSQSGKPQLGDAMLNQGNVIKGKVRDAILRADVKNLLKSIFVTSSNLACIAFANKISGNEAEFVKLMNRTVLDMGLHNTQSKNSHGFPTAGQVQGHYSSARDLMTIMQKVYEVMDRLKVTYPDLFDGINKGSVDLEGYDKNGATSWTMEAHSYLMRETIRENGKVIRNPNYVSGIIIDKTGWSGPSGAGEILFGKVESNGATYNIGYVAGGFDSIPLRTKWMHDKMVALPAKLVNEPRPAPLQDNVVNHAEPEVKDAPQDNNAPPGLPVPLMLIFGGAALYAGAFWASRKQKPPVTATSTVKFNFTPL